MDDENRQYTALLDLSNNKTAAIVNGNVEQLQEIFGKEQKLIDVITRLETEREACVTDICKILHLSPSPLLRFAVVSIFPPLMVMCISAVW